MLSLNPVQADGPELTIEAGGGGKNAFGPFNPPRESILMGVTIHFYFEADYCHKVFVMMEQGVPKKILNFTLASPF